jgi:hypothetical protein
MVSYAQSILSNAIDDKGMLAFTPEVNDHLCAIAVYQCTLVIKTLFDL